MESVTHVTDFIRPFPRVPLLGGVVGFGGFGGLAGWWSGACSGGGSSWLFFVFLSLSLSPILLLLSSLSLALRAY